MDSTVDIRQVQSLVDLKAGLHRFRNEAACSLERIERIHRRIRDELFSLYVSEKRKVERLKGTAQKGNRASGGEIHRAEQRLDTIQKSLRRIEEQIAIYQRYAGKMKKVLANEMPQAEGTLSIKVMEIEEYIAVAMGRDNHPQPEPGTQHDPPGYPLDVHEPTEDERI